MRQRSLHKTITIGSDTYTLEHYKFKDAKDWTAYYNALVKDYTNQLKGPIEYGVNDWTSNSLIVDGKPIHISRFGNTTQLIKSKRPMELEVFKNNIQKIYESNMR